MKKKASLTAGLEAIASDAPLQDQKTVSSDLMERQKDRATITVSITMTRDDLQEINDYCKKMGLSRSSFIRMACKKEMHPSL